MEPYEWMVRSTPQTEWIDGRGKLIWLAEVSNGLGGGFYLASLYFGNLWGMLIGWLIVLCLKGGFHFAYLGKPWRFWRMAANPKTSWLARGFIFLFLFVVLGLLHLAAACWVPGTVLEKALRIGAGVMVFLVVINPGFVMSCIHAIPFWNTAVLPMLFLSCGILDGFALIMAMGSLGHPVEMRVAEAGSRLLLVLNAFIIIIYFWSAAYMGPTGKRSVTELVKGELAPILWVGVALCGVVIPLVVSISSYFAAGVSAPLLIAAILCEMIGAFSLKYVLLKNARYAPLIPSAELR